MNSNMDKHDLLYNAILNLHSVKECRAFLEDLCTDKELETISGSSPVGVGRSPLKVK